MGVAVAVDNIIEVRGEVCCLLTASVEERLFYVLGPVFLYYERLGWYVEGVLK